MAKKGMVPMAMNPDEIKKAADLLRLLEEMETAVAMLDLNKKAVVCEFRLLTSDYVDQSTWADHSIKLGVGMMRTLAIVAVETIHRQLKGMGVEVAG